MQFNSLLSNAKVLFTVASVFITLNAFSQKSKTQTRSEVEYKQLHSSSFNSKNNKLFADGIRLKMDMSALDEAEARREIDKTEIPADDIYGGIWINSNVNIYGALKNKAPESFKVELDNFTMPHEGRMTSNFGTRHRRYHYGVDIKVQVGDTIYAAFDGKIRVKQYERRGYGKYIVVRHLNGLETVYGHLSKFLVDENEFVMSGQPIGLGGNTGRSTGPHLHFETRFLGRPINPNFLIDFDNKVCHRDEYIVNNSSYRKTTTRSSVVSNKGASNYQAPKSTANNKYVDGSVKYHRIRKGDSLGKIAKKYGVTVNKLCKLNKMSSKSTLRVGKSLRVS